MFYVTIYQSNTPIGKVIKDGKTIPKQLTFYSGSAGIREYKDVKTFSESISHLTSKNALGFGFAKDTEVEIITKDEIGIINGVARNKDTFKYRKCPGILFLDYDPKDVPLTELKLLKIFQSVIPELADAPIMYKTSSSSNINGDNIRGQHFFVVVDDTTKIPEFQNTINIRLWNKGYGYIQVSKNGSALKRNLIDISVNSPERLCYIKPNITSPDTHHIETSYYNNTAEPLSFIQPLSSEEINEYNGRVREAIIPWKGSIERAKINFYKNMSKKTGKTIDSIKAMMESKRKFLYKEWPVILADGTEVKVNDILNDIDKYSGQRCHDPIEPDYEQNTEQVAYIYVKNFKAQICSHSHGIQTFYELEDISDPAIEYVDIQVKKDQFTRHDWPPGFAGIFAKEIHKRMAWPNKEISIIASRHVLRSVLGRKANFGYTPLTQINILLADQGVGKNTPSTVLNNILDQALSKMPSDTLSAVKGSKGTYGVRALHKRLIKAPSMSIIIPEAGISSKSQSGDIHKVKQYIMQNLVVNSYSSFDVSDFAEELPDVYCPTMSILEESTSTSYIHNFTPETVSSGEESRKFHHFVDPIPDSMPTIKAHMPFDEYTVSTIQKILLEGWRKENIEANTGNEDPKKPPKFVGCAIEQLNVDDRMFFKPDDYTKDKLSELTKDEYKMRKVGVILTDEERSSFVRKITKVKSEALLYAYIDYVVEDNTFTVNKEHIDYAINYVNECSRSMGANVGVMASQDSRLVTAILEECIEKEGGSIYKKYHNGKSFVNNRLFKHSFLVNSCYEIKKLANSIASDGYKTVGNVLFEAYKEGESLGYWEIIDQNDEEIKAMMGISFKGKLIKLIAKKKGVG